MKKIFYIEDTVTNQVSYWHLVAFLVTLPFDFFYSEIILASFCTHTLIHLKKESFKRAWCRENLVLISIWLLGLITLMYSPDKAEGINILTRQLAIVVFPLALSLNGIDVSKYAVSLMKWFAFTCVAVIIYLYADALVTIQYFKLPFSTLFSLVFMNHNFSLPLELHATYISMYVAFSIVVFACLLVNGASKRLKWLYVICIAILFGGLLQLSSRAVLISLLIVFDIAFPLFLFRGRKRIWMMALAVTVTCCLLFAISNVQSFNNRYFTELKTDLSQKPMLVEIAEPRAARWNSILNLVKRSPVIGYGTGAEKNMLQEMYFREKFYTSYIHQFNTHSEYLSVLLKMGGIGLTLFLYILYYGFASAWRSRNVFFSAFMIIIAVVCISENVLDLNKGIFFYSFFFSIFLLKDRLKEQPEKSEAWLYYQ